MISRGRLLFITASLSCVALLLGGTLLAAPDTDGDDPKDSLFKYLSMFTDVLDLVKRAYVDQTETDALLTGALEGSTDALDPFSMYIPATAVDRYQAVRGIGTRRSGLIVLKERGVAYIVGVQRNSPAASAGLERGDFIASIDERSTREMALWEIHERLAGEVGTDLAIERIRLGQQEIVPLTLAEFSSAGAAELTAVRGVAVLRLDTFDSGTRANVESTLATLRGDGAVLPALRENDKLILDLRNAAGGDEAIAYEVASLFARGDLGVLADRNTTLESFDSEGDPRWQGQMAVLINQGTQGAAEVLAAVLHQRVEATLIGERSFGHSGRQSVIELSNGDRLQITTAFFTGPDQNPINAGLEPDHLVRPRGFGLDDDQSDAVLDRALEVILEESPVELERAA